MSTKRSVAVLVFIAMGIGALSASSLFANYSGRIESSFKTDDPLSAIEKLEELDSAEYYAIRDSDRIDYNLGVYYFERGEFSLAASRFQKVADSSPDAMLRAKARYNIGVGFYRLFQSWRDQSFLELAADSFREALRENPREEDARYNLEKLYQEISKRQVPGKPEGGPKGDDFSEGVPEEDF